MTITSVRRLAATAVMAATLAGAGAAVPVLAADEAITAEVTTDNPTVGQQLTIEGDVTGASMYPVNVVATREDSTGVTPMPVDSQPTDPDGHFMLHDTPPARGSVTYHLSADAGAATADVTTTVAGKPTDLSIDVRPSPANAESSVHVTAHLGSATTNRELTIYAKPYRRSRVQIDRGPVDADGDRTTDRTVRRRTTFTAVFAGDSAYAPATVKTTLKVRAVLDQDLRGGFRTAGDTRLYHQDDNPQLFVHMVPEHKGRCIYFRAQHKEHGEWVRSALSDCAKTSSDGRVIGTLLGPDHIVGTPYRIRAEWHGTRAVARRIGRWLHLEFRR